VVETETGPAEQNSRVKTVLRRINWAFANLNLNIITSVPDPDPLDPYVFGPPGSASDP
jgi:hypothetical protein